MRTRLLIAGLVATTLTVTSGHAFSGDGDFTERKVWYRTSLTPVGNLDYTAGTPATWSDEAPVGPSVGVAVANNYSAFLEVLDLDKRQGHTFTAEGTFSGLLDTIAVDLYFTGPLVSLCGMSLAWDLRIDGVEVLYTDQLNVSADLLVEQESVGPLTLYKVKFMFTRLAEAIELFQIPTGPDAEHELFMNFANFYACQEAVFLYDMEDAPSSMIFNLDPDSEAATAYTEVDVFNPPPPLPS